MKSSRSIVNWTPTQSFLGNKRAATPNRFQNFQNHSMLPLNRMANHRSSYNQGRVYPHLNYVEMMPGSLDPQAFRNFDRMGATYDNFGGSYLVEEAPKGVLNRFSLNRPNKK